MKCDDCNVKSTEKYSKQSLAIHNDNKLNKHNVSKYGYAKIKFESNTFSVSSCGEKDDALSIVPSEIVVIKNHKEPNFEVRVYLLQFFAFCT